MIPYYNHKISKRIQTILGENSLSLQNEEGMFVEVDW